MLDFNDAPDQLDLDGYTPEDLKRIAHALGKATRSGNGYSCLCPAHNDRNPSGYISLGEGGHFLACCYAGCNSWDMVNKIHESGLLVKTNGLSSPVQLPLLAAQGEGRRAVKKEQDWDKQGKIEKIWSETRSAQGTLAETYLNVRIPSLPVIPDVLRFHPAVYHAETKSQYRAMIAKVTFWGEGDRIAIHQTFLKDDGMGKAAIDPDKKMLGSIKGGAVQLFEAGEILGIGEGIETSLSFHVLSGVPVWAALSCTNMAPKNDPLKLPPLPLAQKLVIAIDNDSEDQSLKAAKILKQRAESEGREVFIVRPPLEIKDFNDVFTSYAGKDVDARTLIESVDGKNIDFLFGLQLTSEQSSQNNGAGRIQEKEYLEEPEQSAENYLDQVDDSPEIQEEAYDAVFEELRGGDIENSTSSECSHIALQASPATSVDPWDYALDRLHNSRKNLFITGAGGTGKSTLLKQFRSETKKKIAVVAPTGVAALNVDGQTIHKFFNFSSDVTPDQVFKNAPLSKKEKVLYEKLEILIIDEISMVRADMLDSINLFLQKNGRYPDRPFGGVRVIMIGDPYQLPPIVNDEERPYLQKIRYSTHYFFSAYCYNNIECIELTKIYRQKDEEFIALLNRVRNKTTTEGDLDVLNVRVTDEESFSQKTPAVYLTTTNPKADALNRKKLDLLSGDPFLFRAEISGRFKNDDCPAPSELSLKKGARIMMLNNDSDGRWVNGTLGSVEEVDDNSIFVNLAGSVYLLAPHTWEIGERYLDGDDLKTRNVRTFKQYPLKLAWAITIHKSQGKTFDRAVIDLENVFAEGQTYVALSRCTNLEGICLKTPLKMRHIRVDHRVTQFLHQAKEQEPFEEPEALPPLEEEDIKDSTKTNSLPFVAEAGSQATGNSYVCLPTGTGSDVDLAQHLLHNELKQRYGHIVYDEGGFWNYGSTHWGEIKYKKLEKIIHEYDGKKWINDAGEEKKLSIGENKVKNTLKRLVTEAVDFMGEEQENFFNSVSSSSINGINCLDGFIVIEKGQAPQLIPHNPNHRCRFTLPFHYNPDLIKIVLNEKHEDWINENRLLRKFFYGCFGKDVDYFEKCRLIAQILGFTSLRYTVRIAQPKFIVLYGAMANNGKSEMINLLKNSLAPNDVAEIDPKDFSCKRYRMGLRNKRLNLTAELTNDPLDSSYLKKIITYDTIDAEEKYKMPVTFRCQAMQVWAGNHFPSFIKGMDKGVRRRAGVLEFTRTIPEQEMIPDIAQKIAEKEGDYLLALAVWGAMDIMNTGEFVFPPSSLDAMKQWEESADNVLAFYQEGISVNKTDSLYVSTQSVYDHYAAWSKTSGIRSDQILSKKGFIQRFNVNLPAGVEQIRKETSRGYTGLTLLPFEEGNKDSCQANSYRSYRK